MEFYRVIHAATGRVTKVGGYPHTRDWGEHDGGLSNVCLPLSSKKKGKIYTSKYQANIRIERYNHVYGAGAFVLETILVE